MKKYITKANCDIKIKVEKVIVKKRKKYLQTDNLFSVCV